MLMSMKEVVAWTGTGPFEIAFHAMSWLCFTILLLVKVEDVWDISYYHVFIPLFAAVGVHVFFLAILITKFVLLGHKTHAVTYVTLLLLVLPLLSMLLLAEIQISHYLEKGNDDNLEGFTIAASIFISLLFLSTFVMFRTTQSEDDD